MTRKAAWLTFDLCLFERSGILTSSTASVKEISVGNCKDRTASGHVAHSAIRCSCGTATISALENSALENLGVTQVVAGESSQRTSRERQLEPWRPAPNLKRDLPICRIVPTDCRPSKVLVELGWMESRNLLVRETFFAGRKWNQELDTLIGAQWYAGQAKLPPRSVRADNTNVVAPFTVTPQEGLQNALEAMGSTATVTYNSAAGTKSDRQSAIELPAASAALIPSPPGFPRWPGCGSSEWNKGVMWESSQSVPAFIEGAVSCRARRSVMTYPLNPQRSRRVVLSRSSLEQAETPLISGKAHITDAG